MILVYPVCPDAENERLRYSLRSVAAHLPDAEVILLGGRPSWVRGVAHLPYRQIKTWKGNVPRMLRSFVQEAPEQWTLMNDDFFALSPSPRVEVGYWGTMAQLSVQSGFRSGWYATATHITTSALRAWGYDKPLAFDRVHRPLPIDNRVLSQALERVGSSDILIRSLYGNLVSSVEVTDAKVRGYADAPPEEGWMSTGRDSWRGYAGRVVRSQFRSKCRFEA